MLQKFIIRQSRGIQSCLRQSRAISNSSSLSRTNRTLSPFLSGSSTAPSSRFSRRWVSTDAEQKTLGDEKAAADSSAAQPEESLKQEDNSLQQELEAKKREVIDLKDKYLRSIADFRNLQERSKRDVETARNFAIQRFVTDLLESIDNLDRALSAVSPESLESNSEEASNKDLVNLHSGLKMTESILLSTLKKHGIERFDPMEGEGRKFDPNVDEAVFMAPMEGKDDGHIMHTQSKGYLLNGRVLRAAKVGVVKNSP